MSVKAYGAAVNMSENDKLNIIGKETGVSLGLIVVLLMAVASTFAWIRAEVIEVRSDTEMKVSNLRSELQGRMDLMNKKLDHASDASMKALVIIERVDKRTQQIETELRDRRLNDG